MAGDSRTDLAPQTRAAADGMLPFGRGSRRSTGKTPQAAQCRAKEKSKDPWQPPSAPFLRWGAAAARPLCPAPLPHSHGPKAQDDPLPASRSPSQAGAARGHCVAEPPTLLPGLEEPRPGEAPGGRGERSAAHLHHEQSFTSKRSRSFSIVFLRGAAGQAAERRRRTARGQPRGRLPRPHPPPQARRGLTRCPRRRRRWRPGRPPPCACCACGRRRAGSAPAATPARAPRPAAPPPPSALTGPPRTRRRAGGGATGAPSRRARS